MRSVGQTTHWLARQSRLGQGNTRAGRGDEPVVQAWCHQNESATQHRNIDDLRLVRGCQHHIEWDDNASLSSGTSVLSGENGRLGARLAFP